MGENDLMNAVFNKCANCTHDNVCIYKHRFVAFCKEVAEVLDEYKAKANSAFSVMCKCVHFTKCENTYREILQEQFGVKSPSGSLPSCVCDLGYNDSDTTSVAVVVKTHDQRLYVSWCGNDPCKED